MPIFTFRRCWFGMKSRWNDFDRMELYLECQKSANRKTGIWIQWKRTNDIDISIDSRTLTQAYEIVASSPMTVWNAYASIGATASITIAISHYLSIYYGVCACSMHISKRPGECSKRTHNNQLRSLLRATGHTETVVKWSSQLDFFSSFYLLILSKMGFLFGFFIVQTLRLVVLFAVNGQLDLLLRITGLDFVLFFLFFGLIQIKTENNLYHTHSLSADRHRLHKTYKVFFAHALFDSQLVIVHTWHLLSLNVDGSRAFDQREFHRAFGKFQIRLNGTALADLQHCDRDFDGAVYG